MMKRHAAQAALASLVRLCAVQISAHSAFTLSIVGLGLRRRRRLAALLAPFGPPLLFGLLPAAQLLGGGGFGSLFVVDVAVNRAMPPTMRVSVTFQERGLALISS